MDPRLEFTFQLLIDHTGLSRNSVMDYVFESNMVIEKIQNLHMRRRGNFTRLNNDEFLYFLSFHHQAGPDQRAVLAARKIKTHVVLSRRRNRGPGFIRNGNVLNHNRGGGGGEINLAIISVVCRVYPHVFCQIFNENLRYPLGLLSFL